MIRGDETVRKKGRPQLRWENCIEGCRKGGGGRQVEGKDCRQGEVEKDNSWGGAEVHELASLLCKGSVI